MLLALAHSGVDLLVLVLIIEYWLMLLRMSECWCWWLQYIFTFGC